MRLLRIPTLCFIILSSCDWSETIAPNEILVEIDQDAEFHVNHSAVANDSLTITLKEKINLIREKGYRHDEIVVKLKAHEEVKMGVISAFMEEFRKLELSKVEYSTLH